MPDMRKYTRKEFNVQMKINSMYKQDYKVLQNIDADIDLINISVGGVGFSSSSCLPIDYYFNAEIFFDDEYNFKTVLKIIRKQKIDGVYEYGCEFIGMSVNFLNKIKEYIS